MIHSLVRYAPGRAFLMCCLLFFSAGAAHPREADLGPALQVDVGSASHPISPFIYGINFAGEALASELRLPVRRWGGNATTRYNWKINVANRGSDWFFENLAEASDNPARLPDISAVNSFIEQNRRTGTDSLITVPLIGWTPKDREWNCGFSVAKYGAQQKTDPYWADCGNGMKPDGTMPVAGNDPHDTSAEAGPDFLREWIQYLAGRYGPSSMGGVKFYNLDNEPMLWMWTHRDVHPSPTTYDEMRQRTYDFASALKQADSEAQTLGPVLWGWNAYFFSALDTASDQWWTKPLPDRDAHGGAPFLDWYLQQMRGYERLKGVRILDYLDLHFYPQATLQGQFVSGSDAGSPDLQALRLRSTRALWDATYKDESWINAIVRLIPRMRDWVSNNYPGTKIAITEYNWGALADLNGALAQADILGIFGREKLDLACLWGPAGDSDPWAYAYRMYRNYDGAGGSFGDISVASSSADPGKLAIYAAQRNADGAVTLVVINKTSTDLTSIVNLAGFTPTRLAKVYTYSAENLKAIVKRPDQPVLATSFGAFFTATFPLYSITLLVVPTVPGVTATPNLIFAHFVAGGGFSTSFTLINTGDSTADGILTLTGQDGQPLNVTLAGGAALPVALSSRQEALPNRDLVTNIYPISLAPGATTVVTTSRPGDPDAKSGWAHLDATGGSLGGVATFKLAHDALPSTIAGVLASQMTDSAVIPVDSNGPAGRYVGFAVANPGASDVHITVSAVRTDGTVVRQVQPGELFPLPARQQAAKFLHQYFPELTNFQGSMVVSADPGERVAVVALNQDQALYTAIPVIPQISAWQLVWSDEFKGPDGSAVDSTKWTFDTGGGGWGNNELEYYTDRTDNAHIENGMLVITAQQETYQNRSYTSSRLKTQGLFTQQYGKIEARIRLPHGQGIWPAFWMLGNDFPATPWPTCGEIDIMEHIGKEPSTAHGTIHGPGYSGANGLSASFSLPGGQKFADEFHVFSVEWGPNSIRWYVDGTLYKTRTPADIPPGTKWVFDHPFFIILNVAVGGNWPGNPDPTTVFPQKMLVDYVRVYRLGP